jgi:hypothetical protein
MKLHIVFNKNGEILGAAHLGSGSMRVRPIADEHAGHRAADVTVPSEYRDHNLAALCRKLKVDVGGEVPNLKPRE